MQNKAIAVTVLAQASGGKGIALSLVATNSYYGPFANAIGGQHDGRDPADRDDRPVDRRGHDVGRPSVRTSPSSPFGTGRLRLDGPGRPDHERHALFRATVGTTVSAPTSTTAPVELVNAGHDYYIATTGADANTGKSATDPMADLAALLRAYTLGPDDVVHVRRGHLCAADQCRDSAPATAARWGTRSRSRGPTDGTTAVFNRGSVASTSYGLDITGSNITIANITVTGGYDGVVVEGGATNVTITNSHITANAFDNVLVPYNAGVTGLLIANSEIDSSGANNPGYSSGTDGIEIDSSNGTIALTNLNVHDNALHGLEIDGSTVTVTGGTYDKNGGDGIDDRFSGAVMVIGTEASSQQARRHRHGSRRLGQRRHRPRQYARRHLRDGQRQRLDGLQPDQRGDDEQRGAGTGQSC